MGEGVAIPHGTDESRVHITARHSPSSSSPTGSTGTARTAPSASPSPRRANDTSASCSPWRWCSPTLRRAGRLRETTDVNEVLERPAPGRGRGRRLMKALRPPGHPPAGRPRGRRPDALRTRGRMAVCQSRTSVAQGKVRAPRPATPTASLSLPRSCADTSRIGCPAASPGRTGRRSMGRRRSVVPPPRTAAISGRLVAQVRGDLPQGDQPREINLRPVALVMSLGL